MHEFYIRSVNFFFIRTDISYLMLLGPRYKAKIIKCGIPQHQNVKIFLAPGRVDIGNGQDLAIR